MVAHTHREQRRIRLAKVTTRVRQHLEIVTPIDQPREDWPPDLILWHDVLAFLEALTDGSTGLGTPHR